MKKIYLLIICAFLCTYSFSQQAETDTENIITEISFSDSTEQYNEDINSMVRKKEQNSSNKYEGEKHQQYSSSFFDSILNILSIVIIILLLFITILLLYVIKITKRSSKYMQKKEYNVNDLASNLLHELNCKITNLEKEKTSLQEEIIHLKESLLEKEQQIATYIKSKGESYTVSNSTPTPQISNKPNIKYLKMAKNGQFKRSFNEADSECFYKCWGKSGEIRFEFCGEAGYAIANEPAIFTDVCTIHKGGTLSPTNIENIVPGILDSNLKVIQKAIIKFV